MDYVSFLIKEQYEDSVSLFEAELSKQNDDFFEKILSHGSWDSKSTTALYKIKALKFLLPFISTKTLITFKFNDDYNERFLLRNVLIKEISKRKILKVEKQPQSLSIQNSNKQRKVIISSF